MDYKFQELPPKDYQTTFELLPKDYKVINSLQNEFKQKLKPIFLSINGDSYLDTIPRHNRVAVLSEASPMFLQSQFDSKLSPEITRQNADGFAYYESINKKGCGFLYPATFESKKDNYLEGHFAEESKEFVKANSVEYKKGYQYLGLFDSEVAEILVKNCQIFSKAGGRGEQVLQSNNLQKVVYEGQLTSVQDLKQKGIIDEDFQPAVVSRISRTPWRIKDFNKANNTDRKVMLDEVFTTLNKENEHLELDFNYDLNNEASVEKYMNDFAFQTARNLAVIQNLGKTMTYFNSGNINLALGELVDLDSLHNYNLAPINAEYDIPAFLLKDIRDAIFALNLFIKSMQKTLPNYFQSSKDLRHKLHQSFIEGYTTFFIGKPFISNMRTKADLNTRLKQATQKVAKLVILDNKMVSPVNNSK